MRYFYTILLSFCFVVGFSQPGKEYLYLPEEFNPPDIDKISVYKSEGGESSDPWRIFTESDSVFVYSNFRLDSIIDTLNFLQEFAVWEETDSALHIVSEPNGEYFDEKYFSATCIDFGWVDKDKIILWPRVLRKNNTELKIVFNTTIDADSFSDGKHSHQIIVKEGELRIFNVLKIKDNSLLICRTDQLYNALTKDDLFWIKKGKGKILTERKALIPNWNRIAEGGIPIISSCENIYAHPDSNCYTDTLLKVNSYRGFVNPVEIKNQLFQVSPLVNDTMETYYIDNTNKTFELAHLIDYNQFVRFDEFITILYNNLETRGLEQDLFEYFLKWGTDTVDLEKLNIAQLLGEICEINLTPFRSDEIKRISSLNEVEYRSIYSQLSKVFEQLDSESNLSKYRFYSDMNYYWFPESWIRPDLLSGLRIKGGRPPRPPLPTYKQFDLIYFDNSADIDEKPYERLQSEIRQGNFTLAQIFRNAQNTDSLGHLIYYSNSINPLIGVGLATYNLIVEQMRSGKSNIPNLYLDKKILERQLFLKKIRQITNEVNIHFFVSDKVYNYEFTDRPVMFKEFPERIKSLVAAKANVNVLFYMPKEYINKNIEETLISKINTWNINNKNIKYQIVKY